MSSDEEESPPASGNRIFPKDATMAPDDPRWKGRPPKAIMRVEGVLVSFYHDCIKQGKPVTSRMMGDEWLRIDPYEASKLGNVSLKARMHKFMEMHGLARYLERKSYISGKREQRGLAPSTLLADPDGVKMGSGDPKELQKWPVYTIAEKIRHVEECYRLREMGVITSVEEYGEKHNVRPPSIIRQWRTKVDGWKKAIKELNLPPDVVRLPSIVKNPNPKKRGRPRKPIAVMSPSIEKALVAFYHESIQKGTPVTSRIMADEWVRLDPKETKKISRQGINARAVMFMRKHKLIRYLDGNRPVRSSNPENQGAPPSTLPKVSPDEGVPRDVAATGKETTAGDDTNAKQSAKDLPAKASNTDAESSNEASKMDLAETAEEESDEPSRKYYSLAEKIKHVEECLKQRAAGEIKSIDAYARAHNILPTCTLHQWKKRAPEWKKAMEELHLPADATRVPKPQAVLRVEDDLVAFYHEQVKKGVTVTSIQLGDEWRRLDPEEANKVSRITIKARMLQLLKKHGLKIAQGPVKARVPPPSPKKLAHVPKSLRPLLAEKDIWDPLSGPKKQASTPEHFPHRGAWRPTYPPYPHWHYAWNHPRYQNYSVPVSFQQNHVPPQNHTPTPDPQRIAENDSSNTKPSQPKKLALAPDSLRGLLAERDIWKSKGGREMCPPGKVLCNTNWPDESLAKNVAAADPKDDAFRARKQPCGPGNEKSPSARLDPPGSATNRATCSSLQAPGNQAHDVPSPSTKSPLGTPPSTSPNCSDAAASLRALRFEKGSGRARDPPGDRVEC